MNAIQIAEQFITVRQQRNLVFGDDIAVLGEFGWIVLLDLFIRHRTGKTASMHELCAANHIPLSTGMRTIKCLLDRDFIRQEFMLGDQENTSLELSQETVLKLSDILAGSNQSTGLI